MTSRAHRGAALPNTELIAYFCAEYGISDKLPIYSGGLGVLAGDIVQEADRQNLPFVAIGLFYQKGYFHQEVDEDGQKESPQLTDPVKVPLELAVDEKGETILIEIPVHERTVYAQIWKFDVGETPLFLLDTNHWKNSPEDRTITDQLYSGGQEKRIMQELVLALGGFRALQLFGLEPTVYHMNEGHSAFLTLELTRSLLPKFKNDLNAAREAARKHLVYTNHTLVPAGNDVFSHDLVRTYVGRYAYEAGLGIENVISWGDAGKDKPGFFSMALLAMRGSYKSNAVSKLHGREAKRLWPDQNLHAITNGIYTPAWAAKEWQDLWNEFVPHWKQNLSDVKTWRNIHKIPNKEFWQTHQQLKRKLLDEVYNREGVQLDEDVLTVVWARRFATYKRPDLLFRDVERLKKLIFHADRPIQVIVAGKAHPADTQGKEIIDHIANMANYDLKRHAIFVDDYSINLSKYLVAGADIWLNTPIFGLEASGTSGMKAATNGVIQFTTPDGWAWEVDWYGIGYALPVEHADEKIYNLFEKKIAPTYYKRTRDGVPSLWVEMMKETMATVLPRFSATRMVNEYVETMYATRPR